LVKRAPRLYGYNGGTASSGTVDLTINLRISFTIDFRNRTLDNVANTTGGGMQPQSVGGSAGLQSTTSMTGLVNSAVGSNYICNLPFNRPYLVNNGGLNDAIYRPYTRKCAKYVLITGHSTATTLTGSPVLGTDVNLSAYYPAGTNAPTAGNTCTFSYLFTVDNTEVINTGTLNTPTTVLGQYAGWGNSGTSITYLSSGVGSLKYNWAVNLGNFTAVATPALSELTVCEFNEGNELAGLERHGLCTVEGMAFAKYSNIPFNKRPSWQLFLSQFQRDREEKKDEVTYWRSRALGNDFSKV
jgi:hypothetical protein